MQASQPRDDGFVPASFGVAVPDHLTNNPTAVRIAYKPFHRRDHGDPDHGHPGYRVVDARGMYTANRVWDGGPVGFLEGIGGSKLVLADGECFRPGGDLPGWAKSDLSLSEDGLVLGLLDGDGGYVAIGTNVVLFVPE